MSERSRSPSVWMRIAALAIGVACCGFAWLVDPVSIVPGLRGSWFFSAERVADLCVALAALGVVVALLPWWSRVLAREPRIEAEPTSSRRARLVDLVFVAALVGASVSLWAAEDPITKDTKFYLGEALDIARRGGVIELVERCFRGEWTEDNRHPLLLALLAPFAEESNAFLARARLVSLAAAVLALVVVRRAARRRGGETAASLAGLCLITNAAYVEHATVVGCESLWIACAAAACDLLTRSAGDGSTRALGRERLCVFGAGVCIGLAFLAKGTGVLLLAGCVAWLVAARRRGQRREAWRELLILGLGFALAAAPLLVRNQRVFDDPFWNVNSRQAMWLDRWEGFHDPATLAAASPGRYLAEHSTGEIAGRFASGAIKVTVHAMEACAPLLPRAGFGLAVLVLLVAGLWASRDRPGRALFLWIAVPWLASFAWYADIASDRRFLVVLLPLALPAFVAWSTRLSAGEARVVRGGALLAALVIAVFGLSHAGAVRRAIAFEPAPWNDALRAWLADRTRDDRDAIYLLGPSATLGFDADRSLLATRRARPRDEAGLRRLLEGSEGERVRFLVVEAPIDPARLGASWVRADETGALRALTIAESPWTPSAAFPEHAPRAIVFERRR